MKVADLTIVKVVAASQAGIVKEVLLPGDAVTGWERHHRDPADIVRQL